MDPRGSAPCSNLVVTQDVNDSLSRETFNLQYKYCIQPVKRAGPKKRTRLVGKPVCLGKSSLVFLDLQVR